MPRQLTLSMILAIGLAANSLATVYTGNIVGGGTLTATTPWNTSDTTLSWVVDDTTHAGYWTYSYKFTGFSKDVSHVILEVSDNFTESNIYDISDETGIVEGPDPYALGGSNPGMPAGGIYGIKWETGYKDDAGVEHSWVVDGVYEFSIVTERNPMWGDFYAKDGKIGTGQNKTDVYVYNSMFGTDTAAAIGDNENEHGWVLVPDTTVIPEPSSIVVWSLIGAVAATLGLWRRKRQA